MEHISAFTLVDITLSKVIDDMNINRPEYHQMQNLQMLLQTIGMKTQPLEYNVDILTEQNMEDYNFSSMHAGVHTVWRLNFSTDFSGVWETSNGYFSNLVDDMHGIAIVNDLDNTAMDFPIDIFDTKNNVNLYFEINDKYKDEQQ